MQVASYVQRDNSQTLYTRRAGHLAQLTKPQRGDSVSYIWSFLAGVEYGNSTYRLSSN